MADTDPAITHATRRHLAAGYRHFYDDRPWRREHGHVPATWLETDTADGCLAGTASDLACYLRMLMNGGAQPDGLLLSEAAFDLMTTPHARLPGARLDPDEIESGGYGYGIYSYVQDDRHHIGHGGGMVGWHTHMLADRTTGIGAVVLINGPGACESLAEYALQLLRANADDQPLPDPPEVRDPMHVENAGDYAGRYRGDDEDLEVVSFADGLRMTCGNSAAELVLRENDVFQVQHPDFELFLLRFERDESGEIVGVAHGGRYWRADGATSSPADYPNAWSGYPGHYRSHNPWLGNFRIVLRAGRLYLVTPSGYEEPVTQRRDGLFRVGDEQSPEFISFDTVVDGEAWRANYSGCDYYRFFTP